MSLNAYFNRPSRALPLLAFILSTVAATAQATEKAIAETLLEKTGVAYHLAEASNAIFTDALPKYSQCITDNNAVMAEDEGQQLKTLIEQHFGRSLTLSRAVDEMNDALSVADQQAVNVFFESSVGVRIIAAEVASKDYSERTFNKLMERHLKSSAWDEARIALLIAVYDSTRAARFVSTLNGEITVASMLSSHCDTGVESLDKLLPHLETLRSESRFVEPIMRGELIRVVATVFRNIPNSDLETYIEFAQSELGVKFFDALLSSTAKGLSGGVSGLTLSLQE